MSYNKLELKNGTAINEDHFAHLEDGIYNSNLSNYDTIVVTGENNSKISLSLDDIAYEDKTYRELFVTKCRMSFDMELDRLDVTYSPSSADLIYDTSIYYTGSRSLKVSNSSTTSKYYYVSSDTSETPGGVYLATMVYVSSYTSGAFGMSMDSGKVICYDEITDANKDSIVGKWRMISTYETSYTPTGHVYFGGFKSPIGTAYIDNVVAIDLGTFKNKPSKEKLDELYINYCNILKGTCVVDSKTLRIVNYNDDILNPILTGNYKYSSEDAHKVIVDLMNKKAKDLGMTNTIYNNPYGGNLYDFNSITARDLMKLTVHMAGYPKTMRYLSLNGNRHMKIYGRNPRTYDVPNTIQNDFDTAYVNVHGSGECPYKMLAGKGGGWSSPVEQRVYCYNIVCEIEGKMVAAVVSRISGNGTHTAREHRLMAIIELCDICAKAIKNESVSGMSVTNAEYACACIIPNNPVIWQNREFEILYEQDADVRFNPASTSKCMSSLVFEDIGIHAYEILEMLPEEFVNSGTTFKAQKGDLMYIDDCMYVNLIISNGPNTLALSRHFGNKVLSEREKFGINEHFTY